MAVAAAGVAGSNAVSRPRVVVVALCRAIRRRCSKALHVDGDTAAAESQRDANATLARSDIWVSHRSPYMYSDYGGRPGVEAWSATSRRGPPATE